MYDAKDIVTLHTFSVNEKSTKNYKKICGKIWQILLKFPKKQSII